MKELLFAAAYLHGLCLVVARVDRLLALAGLAQQLPSIVLDRCEGQRAVAVLDEGAMLPLHNATGAGGILRVRDGAVVGGLVVAVLGEGVGDAGALGLDQFIVQRVVESLQGLSARQRLSIAWHTSHTGPVRVLLDLVLHVPIKSAGHVPCAEASAARQARPATEDFMMWSGAAVFVERVRVLFSEMLLVAEGECERWEARGRARRDCLDASQSQPAPLQIG